MKKIKLHLYKILLVVPLLLFASNLSAQSYDCRWTGNTDLDFNKTTNWVYYDSNKFVIIPAAPNDQ
jgi:hypothetical protein